MHALCPVGVPGFNCKSGRDGMKISNRSYEGIHLCESLLPTKTAYFGGSVLQSELLLIFLATARYEELGSSPSRGSG